jgi:hypothetical protein
MHRRIDDPNHTFRGQPLAEILRPVMGPGDFPAPLS